MKRPQDMSRAELVREVARLRYRDRLRASEARQRAARDAMAGEAVRRAARDLLDALAADPDAMGHRRALASALHSLARERWAARNGTKKQRRQTPRARGSLGRYVATTTEGASRDR